MAVAHDVHISSGPAAWFHRLWPAAVGVVFAGVLAAGLADGTELAALLAAAHFVYLGAAALRRPAAAWPLFWLTFVVIGVGRAVGGPDPTWVILGLAVAFAVYGLARGAARDPEGLPRQASAMVVFGAVAAVVLLVGGDAAGYVVAAGLLAHAGWDIYHRRTGKVVTRSMAEFCFVLDTLVAIAMIVVLVVR
jgi:hypothetical protein